MISNGIIRPSAPSGASDLQQVLTAGNTATDQNIFLRSTGDNSTANVAHDVIAMGNTDDGDDVILKHDSLFFETQLSTFPFSSVSKAAIAITDFITALVVIKMDNTGIYASNSDTGYVNITPELISTFDGSNQTDISAAHTLLNDGSKAAELRAAQLSFSDPGNASISDLSATILEFLYSNTVSFVAGSDSTSGYIRISNNSNTLYGVLRPDPGLTGIRDWKLPDKNGTLALTTDYPTLQQVLTAGATSNITIVLLTGSYSTTTTTAGIFGNYNGQPAYELLVTPGSIGVFRLHNGSFYVELQASAITATRSVGYQDKSGTMALLENFYKGTKTLVAGTITVLDAACTPTSTIIPNVKVAGGVLGTQYKCTPGVGTYNILAINTAGAAVTTDTSTLDVFIYY